jgi:hypothetical protein
VARVGAASPRVLLTVAARSSPEVEERAVLLNDRPAVVAAFRQTPAEYLARCLLQRNPDSGRVGSIFREPLTIGELMQADWRPIEHPNVQPPFQAYRAPSRGELGVISLNELFPGSHVRLADTKKTGQLKPVVIVRRYKRAPVEHSTLIVGPDPETGRSRVWSFYPGDPQPLPPRVRPRFEDELVTVNDAHAMGFEWAEVDPR